MVLMDNGKVLVWGENRKSLINDIEAISSPTELTSLSHLRVKSVHNYNYRFFVITEDYKVYSWGWNYYDNLGHDPAHNEVMSPTHIAGLSEFDIIDLASSLHNTYFLSGEGKVFFCGMYTEGQTTKWQIQPILMAIKESFVELQSIQNNCLGLTDHDIVYVFNGKSINRNWTYYSFEDYQMKKHTTTFKTEKFN